MPNAKNVTDSGIHRLLVVGPTGAGKTKQIWTLPGKRFAYIFDPNAMSTLRGCDLDYEEYYPDFLEMDASLKGFNKDSTSDSMLKITGKASKREPHVYMEWVKDLNNKVEKGFFNDYQWLCFDSLTFLSKATMDRQLFINKRYGDIEELADYRVVGSKLSDIFNSIAGLRINIYATGHLQTFQDEKTKKVTTNIWLPGKARNVLPLLFTDVWLAGTEDTDKGVRHLIRTRPETRGLQDIRCSIPGLGVTEDVTIEEAGDLTKQGIGAILRRSVQPVRKGA